MSHLPKLVIIRGSVGAGKTSVVEALRRKLGDVSIIDFDAFKRQIDNTKSSAWRREIAVDTALYLCERIMQKKRDIIIDSLIADGSVRGVYKARGGTWLQGFYLHATSTP